MRAKQQPTRTLTRESIRSPRPFISAFHFPSSASSFPSNPAMLALRISAGERLWVTPAVTFEQGGSDAVYGSLSLNCRL